MAINSYYYIGVTGEVPVPMTGMVNVAWRVTTVGIYPRELVRGKFPYLGGLED